MANVFLISDTHFGHSKIYKQPFLKDDGSYLRPWSSAEEADQAMVDNWNAVVKQNDKVYHLGDVAIPRSGIKVLDRLNGDKVLIAGNHDSMWMPELQKKFRAVRAYWKIDNTILSHVPIHCDSLRNFQGNVHGHLHGGQVKLSTGEDDARYVNVCVEKINYTPIHWDEVASLFHR